MISTANTASLLNRFHEMKASGALQPNRVKMSVDSARTTYQSELNCFESWKKLDNSPEDQEATSGIYLRQTQLKGKAYERVSALLEEEPAASDKPAVPSFYAVSRRTVFEDESSVLTDHKSGVNNPKTSTWVAKEQMTGELGVIYEETNIRYDNFGESYMDVWILRV